MAKHGKVAFRYARAIFEQFESAADRKNLMVELEKFGHLMAENKELSFVLNSPVFSEIDRRPVIEDVAKKMKLGDVTVKTLLVLSSMNRMGAIGAIVERVKHLLLDSANVVSLGIKSADQLGNEEKGQIEQRFKKILGKNVEASYEVDPSLLGGLQVVAGGRTYDGSLSGWLHSFEEQLVGGNI